MKSMFSEYTVTAEDGQPTQEPANLTYKATIQTRPWILAI